MTVKHQSSLVLEGGGSRGVFTAGVLDYLMEKEVKFPYVVGVSAGSCNALDYVSWQPGRTRDCMIIEDKANSYIATKEALKKHELFDMDMLFDKYPNELFPFDFDTFFQSDTECELVVTNCQTGDAEYMTEKHDRKRLMDIGRASSSIPVVSPMVEIDGVPYLDSPDPCHGEGISKERGDPYPKYGLPQEETGKEHSALCGCISALSGIFEHFI